MIETLSLQNFKVLRSVDVRLRPLTLIVGPNSSGKSSLLRALDLGLRSLEDPPTDRHMSFYGLQSRVSDGPVELRLFVRLGRHCWDLTLLESGPAKLIGDDPVAFREEKYFSAILDLDLKRLAAPSPEHQIIRTLPSDGSGLAWILAGLHLEAHGQFNEIFERLRAVVPTVQGLRIKRTTLEPKGVGYELLFDMKGGKGISAESVSEGTLMTLALLVVLAGPNPPGLVLIENLERGLHPKALRDLVDQIRLLQKQNPRLQVVATSHSPYLLDYLEADEILLTSLDEDGYASVKALSEHPEYDRWKDVMAPGEFWSTVGESWVVQKT
jgi:predicted ATPase